MSFEQNVDVIPPHYSQSANEHMEKLEAQKMQKNKWRVLLLTFFIVLLPALIWIWSQPAIYQSQAIIHFTYPQQIGRELSTVPEEQITLNEQRLTSYRVLQTLSAELAQEQQLMLNPEQLDLILSTEAQTASRIINLMATSEQVEILEPVLSTWLALYLGLLKEETVVNNSEDIALTEDKVGALEQKIIEQREVLQAYSDEHNIISVERDENRTLSKIKGMNRSLEEADNNQASALAALETIETATNEGKVVTNPRDKARIDRMTAEIGNLQAELKSLASRYTEKYMERDPVIKGKVSNLATLEERLESLVQSSQVDYLQELKRTLETATNNQKLLASQLDELSKQAKEFNLKLSEYKRLDNSVRQLEAQAQALKDQVIEKEVEKPYEARINVLEQPFVPSFPIGPAYWLQSAIAAAAAILVSLMALLVYSFIMRQKQSASMTNYTVVPPAAMLGQQQDPMLAHQQQAKLGHQQTPLGLSHQTDAASLRLLSETECKTLYQVANDQGKLVISLILSGVSQLELEQLEMSSLNLADRQLILAGLHERTIALTEKQCQLVNTLGQSSQNAGKVWPSEFTGEDFNQIIINSAHDAGVAFPEQLTLKVLRHTYLTYLVTQGARLNDLEKIAGSINPAELGQYRAVNRQGNPLDIDQINTVYPLD